MKHLLFALILIFSNFTAHGLTITSGITTVTNRGTLASRQFEESTTGHAIAIWTENSYFNQVQAAYFNGSGWLQPVTIASGAFPQVGVASNGVAHAIWLNTLNTSSTQIFSSRFNPSTNTWSAQVQLSNMGVNSAPQIAVNSQGNALAVWIQNYPASLQAATYNASTGTWTGPFTLINGSLTSPQVTLDDSNRGVVQWFGSTFGIEAITVSVP